MKTKHAAGYTRTDRKPCPDPLPAISQTWRRTPSGQDIPGAPRGVRALLNRPSAAISEHQSALFLASAKTVDPRRILRTRAIVSSIPSKR